jgi:tetratricopeptide (TPR) repeat protein
MAEESKGPILDVFANMPDEDLDEILASVRKGANKPAEFFGFDDGAMNAVESAALGFYRARMWEKAALVFGFALRLDPDRTSCWRGLGACAHAAKEYPVAEACYAAALERNANDMISKVLLGECLCLQGKTEQGLALLEAVIRAGSSDPATKPYLTRARAIIGAGGGVPPTIVLRNMGIEIAEKAAASLAEAALDLDPNREISVEDMKKDPRLAAALGDLSKAFQEGRLTLAEVGGFTDNELDGAYACACKYAEMGQLGEAAQIAGYLIFIDPYKARYYQLVAICMQRLKMYEAADHFYGLSLSIEPGDVRSLIFRGETKIMMGHTDDGLRIIREGMSKAQGKADLLDLVNRGQILIRQFQK